jgi:hypothetical protein
VFAVTNRPRGLNRTGQACILLDNYREVLGADDFVDDERPAADLVPPEAVLGFLPDVEVLVFEPPDAPAFTFGAALVLDAVDDEALGLDAAPVEVEPDFGFEDALALVPPVLVLVLAFAFVPPERLPLRVLTAFAPRFLSDSTPSVTASPIDWATSPTSLVTLPSTLLLPLLPRLMTNPRDHGMSGMPGSSASSRPPGR